MQFGIWKLLVTFQREMMQLHCAAMFFLVRLTQIHWSFDAVFGCMLLSCFGHTYCYPCYTSLVCLFLLLACQHRVSVVGWGYCQLTLIAMPHSCCWTWDIHTFLSLHFHVFCPYMLSADAFTVVLWLTCCVSADERYNLVRLMQWWMRSHAHC